MRFSMILEMVDRLSGPAKRAKAGVSGLRDAARGMGQQVRRAAGDLRRGERGLSDIARSGRRVAGVGLRRIFESAGAGARKLGRDLAALERRLKLTERAGFATGRGLRKLGGMAAGLMKTGVLAGGAAGAGAGAFALFDLFRDAGNVEQAQNDLAGFIGSVEDARRELDWVKNANVHAPIGALIEGYVKLRKAGIQPTEQSLRAIADEARASKMEFGALAEVFKQVRVGDYGGLQALGIGVSQKNGIATLTFLNKEGKRVSKMVKDSADEIERAVLGVFEGRSSGAADRYRSSMFGLIDGLRDRWNRFQLMIADAGIFDVVKKDLDALLAKIGEMAKNGELQRWAEKISERLKKAWEWGTAFVDKGDWDRAVQDFKDIAEAIGLVADAILTLKRMKDDFSWISNIGTINPIRGLRALNGLREGDQTGSSAATTQPRTPARLPVDNALSRKLTGKQSSFNIGGALKIDVKSSPDLAVRATPVATPGRSLPMEVRTGKTMRSAA